MIDPPVSCTSILVSAPTVVRTSDLRYLYSGPVPLHETLSISGLFSGKQPPAASVVILSRQLLPSIINRSSGSISPLELVLES